MRETAVRLPDEILAGVDGVARRNDRSRSQQIRRYLREGLSRDGVVTALDADQGADHARGAKDERRAK